MLHRMLCSYKYNKTLYNSLTFLLLLCTISTLFSRKKTAAHCAGIILRIAAVFSYHFIVQLSMLLILFVERFLFHYGASTFYHVSQAPYNTRYNHPHFTFHCSPFFLRTGTRSKFRDATKSDMSLPGRNRNLAFSIREVVNSFSVFAPLLFRPI